MFNFGSFQRNVLNNHFLGQNLTEQKTGSEKVGCSRIIQKANYDRAPRGVNSQEAGGTFPIVVLCVFIHCVYTKMFRLRIFHLMCYKFIMVKYVIFLHLEIGEICSRQGNLFQNSLKIFFFHYAFFGALVVVEFLPVSIELK
jgi:hypothetical protein